MIATEYIYTYLDRGSSTIYIFLVLLFRLATLLPSSYLPRQFFSILKRFWALLKSPERLKHPLYPFFLYTHLIFLHIFFMHVFLFFLVFLFFCLVCFSLFFLSLCSYLHSFFFSNFPLLQLQIGGLCQPRYPVTSGHIPMHRHVPA